jgi:hypothetical protein
LTTILPPRFIPLLGNCHCLLATGLAHGCAALLAEISAGAKLRAAAVTERCFSRFSHPVGRGCPGDHNLRSTNHHAIISNIDDVQIEIWIDLL